MRTLPPDYNEWRKANGFDPVDMDYSVDDQWVYQQISTHSSVELRSQECSAKPIAKKIGKDGSDLAEVRELAPSAASVLMRIMYAARMARFDLLRPV